MPNPLEQSYKTMMDPQSRACLTAAQIQSYVRQEMPDQERKITEQHLIECNICSEAVEGALQIGVQAAEEHLASLNQKIRERFTSGNAAIIAPKKAYARLVYSMAAVLLLTLTAVIYYGTRTPYEKLFAEYVKPYSNAVPLVRGEAPNSLLQDAMMSYELEDYRAAVQKLQTIIHNDPSNTTAVFYGGVSYLMLGDGGRALDLLQSVSNRSEFYEAAQWYLALAFLKNGEIGRAKTLFENIASDGGFYSGSSKEILQHLN
jgi:tetratricopeptide (TPR) repeat protein